MWNVTNSKSSYVPQWTKISHRGGEIEKKMAEEVLVPRGIRSAVLVQHAGKEELTVN